MPRPEKNLWYSVRIDGVGPSDFSNELDFLLVVQYERCNYEVADQKNFNGAYDSSRDENIVKFKFIEMYG